jgi:hypothetical protein
MTTTLLETWRTARSLASKEPVLKPRINELVDQGSDEVEQTIAQLRETHRDDAVELQALARAIAARSDLELNGKHQQVQLLLLPVLVSLDAGPAAEPQHLPDLPASLTLEVTLCRTLGLAAGSLRAAPFLVSAASMAELTFAEIRELGMHLSTMGDYGKLAPALLEREPDQPSRQTLYLPLVWLGDAQEPLPQGLAEQGLRPAYMETKYRLEEVLEAELASRCGLKAKVTAFKPVSFAMAFGFLRRATLFMDVRQLAKSAGSLAGASLTWKLARDMLSMDFELRGQHFHHEAVVAEESDASLVELIAQLAAGLKLSQVIRRS